MTWFTVELEDLGYVGNEIHDGVAGCINDVGAVTGIAELDGIRRSYSIIVRSVEIASASCAPGKASERNGFSGAVYTHRIRTN